MAAVRAVVDTNVWVSALLNPSGPPAAVRHALQQQRFVLVSSEPLLAELAEVLARPRFAQVYRVTRAEVIELVALVRERGDLVSVTGSVRICRDPDDDAVVETALNGRADALVTRDDDLSRGRPMWWPPSESAVSQFSASAASWLLYRPIADRRPGYLPERSTLKRAGLARRRAAAT